MIEECPDTTIEFPPDIPVMSKLIEDCKRVSGRNELLDEQWIVHINDAQRHLDRMVEREQQRAQNFYNLDAGHIGVTFSSRCRAIDQAWVVDNSVELCARLHLENISSREMHDYWLTGSGNSDYPCFYSKAYIRHAPGNIRIGEMGGPVAFNETALMPAYCNGIIVWPAASRPITVEVVANFYDDILSTEWPYSWWLVNHPDLLTKATMRELEVYMRNSQGVNDYDQALASDLNTIDLDEAEQKASNIVRFYG